MTERRTASEQITEEVGSWAGVEVDDGELGELSFHYGRREIGHLHGDHAAHFSFPRPLWHQLHDAGVSRATRCSRRRRAPRSGGS